MNRNVKAGETIILGDSSIWMVCQAIEPNERLPKGRCHLVNCEQKHKWFDTLLIPEATELPKYMPVCVTVSQTVEVAPKTLTEALANTKGIEFYPYVTWGWGSAGYDVNSDGTLTFVGANWDSSG